MQEKTKVIIIIILSLCLVTSSLNFLFGIFKNDPIKEKIYFVDVEVNKEIDQLIQQGKTEQVYKFYDQFTNNREVTHHIVIAALSQDVPINIAFATAWTESCFTKSCLGINKASNTRDIGLFQLNDSCYPDYKESELFDIKLNSTLGCKELKDNFKSEKSWIKAVCKYNRGHVTDLGINYVSVVYEKLDILNKKYCEAF
jgi:hypothetical protein